MSSKVQPFIGPHPFEESDSPFFYGRDKEIQEILALILSANVSLIYSKSGLGKTSIFNAKIIPELKAKKHKIRVLPITRFKTISTLNYNVHSGQNNFNIYIFNTLSNIIEKDSSLIENENLSKEKLLNMTLSEFLKEYTISQKEKHFDKHYHDLKIIIFDQFEEFFNVYSDDVFLQQRNFFYQIRDAINNDPNLRIVIIMREEYIASLDTFSDILPDQFRRKFRLEPLGEELAKYAVEKPLLLATLLDPTLKTIINEGDIKKIANKVVENLLKIHVQRYNQPKTMIKDSDNSKILSRLGRKFKRNQSDPNSSQVEITSGEFVEPVQLQVVCLKIWENKILTGKIRNEIDAIDLGDVDNALTEFYVDAVIAAKDNTKTKERVIREWCEEQLITAAGTRNIVYQDIDVTAGLSNKVVNILQSKYLIRTEERAGSKWCELTHDRMIKPIKESNKDYEEKQRRKITNIIKIMIPVIAVLSIITINAIYPYFESIVAQDVNKETLINTNVTIKLDDIDTEKYYYLIKSFPNQGNIYTTVSNDTIVYSPPNRYIGHEAFTYVVSNGAKDSNTGLINIHVKPYPLKAINQTVESITDKPQLLSLIDWTYPQYKEIRDTGHIPIKLPRLTSNASMLNGPYHGYLAADIHSNRVIYTPFEGYVGSDYFEYCLLDPENTTNCSKNENSFGNVELNIRTIPEYFGYLMVDNGITKGTLYPIYSTTNTIGRATFQDKPDIAIDTEGGTISRLNAKIFFNGSFFIEDLESTNDIFYEGKRLENRNSTELKTGDTFTVGGISGIKLKLITDPTNMTQFR